MTNERIRELGLQATRDWKVGDSLDIIFARAIEAETLKAAAEECRKKAKEANLSAPILRKQGAYEGACMAERYAQYWFSFADWLEVRAGKVGA